MQARSLVSALVLLGTGCATATDDGGAGQEIVFHGEQAALPDFNYDTGFLPVAQPVQLRLAFSVLG